MAGAAETAKGIANVAGGVASATRASPYTVVSRGSAVEFVVMWDTYRYEETQLGKEGVSDGT